MTLRPKFDPSRENRRWMPYVVLCIIAAWAGLWGVIHLPVTNATQVLFFVLLFLAVSTTVMPAVAYLNARFGKTGERRIHQIRFVRQSIWFGLWAAISAWLQTQRVLNLMLALILIAVFALMETFLITRESPADE